MKYFRNIEDENFTFGFLRFSLGDESYSGSFFAKVHFLAKLRQKCEVRFGGDLEIVHFSTIEYCVISIKRSFLMEIFPKFRQNDFMRIVKLFKIMQFVKKWKKILFDN